MRQGLSARLLCLFGAVAQEQLLYVCAGDCGVMELHECCLPSGGLEGKVVSPDRKGSGTQQKVWVYFGSLAEFKSVLSSWSKKGRFPSGALHEG